MQRRILVALASVATMALAVPAVAHSNGDTSTAGDTESSDTRTSDAEITTTDCVVESTKDISYIAYFNDGMLVDKENINAPTFDLATVDGIDEIDQIEAKSGTTVETFEIDCPAEPTGDDTASDDTKSGDTRSDGTDDTKTDETDDTETDDEKTDDEKTEGDKADHREKDHKRGDRFDSRGNSEATITLDGCRVESSKDISYIAFYDDGTFVEKDENIDEETFDLTTVDDIDDIDDIDVKSGTTVETFQVDCTEAASDDEQKSDEQKLDDRHDDRKSDDRDDDGTSDRDDDRKTHDRDHDDHGRDEETSDDGDHDDEKSDDRDHDEHDRDEETSDDRDHDDDD